MLIRLLENANPAVEHANPAVEHANPTVGRLWSKWGYALFYARRAILREAIFGVDRLGPP